MTTVSQPDEDWNGNKGRVTVYLEELNLEAQYYLCGSGLVITDVTAHLEGKGIPAENILRENFG